MMVVLSMEALCRLKWIDGVGLIAAGLRRIWSPSLVGDTTRLLLG